MFKPYSCGDHLDVEVEINSTGGYMIAHVFRFAQADLNLWQSHPEVERHTVVSGFCQRDQGLCPLYSICPSLNLFRLR